MAMHLQTSQISGRQGAQLHWKLVDPCGLTGCQELVANTIKFSLGRKACLAVVRTGHSWP